MMPGMKVFSSFEEGYYEQVVGHLRSPSAAPGATRP
jgi:hypothetical protein